MFFNNKMSIVHIDGHSFQYALAQDEKMLQNERNQQKSEIKNM